MNKYKSDEEWAIEALSDWRNGYLDCLSGEVHKSGLSNHYDEGFADCLQILKKMRSTDND